MAEVPCVLHETGNPGEHLAAAGCVLFGRIYQCLFKLFLGLEFLLCFLSRLQFSWKKTHQNTSRFITSDAAIISILF